MITLIKPSGGFISLVVGDTVEAEVLNLKQEGEVSLRIAGQTISATSDISFAKGDVILLKVLGCEKDLQLQFLGVQAKDLSQSIQPQDGPLQDGVSLIPAKIVAMLTDLAGARLSSEDIKVLADILTSLPEEIRAAFPELKALENFLPEIQHLNGQLLQSSVENSGVFLEMKLKIAAQEMFDEESATRETGQEPSGQTPSEEGEDAIPGEQPPQAEGRDVSIMSDGAIREDLKGILLRAAEMLKDATVTESLKLSGSKFEEAGEIIGRMVKTIEFFQVSSKANEMLHTFLPVSWHELKDGELIFKRSRDRGTDLTSYYCTLNLDLASAGKMSISVTMYEKAFYVSFRVEDERTHALLNSHKALLEKQFAHAGIFLKAVNFKTEAVSFGEPPAEGFHMRI
jgi:flagellar hook-length control protein FliK